MSALDVALRSRIASLSTTVLSDALDKLGVGGAVIGILPLYTQSMIVGEAVTILIGSASVKPSSTHLGVEAIASAQSGSVIVIDNRGDVENNCWGEVLACAAQMRGVNGVVVDGAVRDVDACQEMGFPVMARGVVPITARGRVVQEDYNCRVQLGTVAVHPGDVIIGDMNGVVIVPPEHIDEVVFEAEALTAREEAMKSDLRAGMDILEVDRKYAYESMLARDEPNQ